MKLDIKSILILALSVGFIFFFLRWYMEGSSNKKESKLLLEQVKNIQKERDSIYQSGIVLKSDYSKLETELSKNKSIIEDLDKKLYNSQIKLKGSEDKLNSINVELSKTKESIKFLKENPYHRTGVDLMNSINEKLNK